MGCLPEIVGCRSKAKKIVGGNGRTVVAGRNPSGFFDSAAHDKTVSGFAQGQNDEQEQQVQIRRFWLRQNDERVILRG